jgi:hypothetical protein
MTKFGKFRKTGVSGFYSFRVKSGRRQTKEI